MNKDPYTVILNVTEKDKASSYLEATYKCEILGRGNDWILAVDK